MNPVKRFEEDFMEYVDSPYAVAVNSGTAALHTAQVALGIHPGDIVITTPFTFPATSNTILMTGATPVFVDIDPETNLIDPEQVEKACKLYLQAKAVIPVHLFGRACRIYEIVEVADKYGLHVIEDASQAVGARLDGRQLGTFGDAGTFSFYASKNLSAYQGGMIVTSRAEVAERAKAYRRHGFVDGEMVSFGLNYEMPWICAFEGQQNLYNHKVAIEAELGKVSEKDGYYKKLVYQHQWYQDNKHLWKKLDCPNAEKLAKEISDNCI